MNNYDQIPQTKASVEMPPVKPPRKQITFKVSRLTKPWALKGTESAIRALSGNALDNFDVKLEVNDRPREMKTIRNIKMKNDPNYWKHKFMQVLEAMADNELSWAKDHWASYGITKYARVEVELDLSKIIYSSEPPAKKIKIDPKLKLTKDEKLTILRDLVEPESLIPYTSIIREFSILNKMLEKFPHKEFWAEGFKPAIKVSSLTYWYNRQEVEDLYRNWAIDLSSKVDPVVLEKEKIGVDILVEKRKARNLLELLS